MDSNGRIWNEAQTAKYLGRSTTWLRRRRGALERDGFPKVDLNLGGRDSRAIIQFLDQRSGLDQKGHPQTDLLRTRARAIANDKHK